MFLFVQLTWNEISGFILKFIIKVSDELTLSTQVCLLHWKMNPSRRFTICFIRVGFRRNNCHSRVSGELKMSWNKEKRDNLQSCCFASRAFRPGNFAPHFRTRGTLYLKPACFGLWLKEREISHIKRAWFALWLIGRGILHLKRVKWLENRGAKWPITAHWPLFCSFVLTFSLSRLRKLPYFIS